MKKSISRAKRIKKSIFYAILIIVIFFIARLIFFGGSDSVVDDADTKQGAVRSVAVARVFDISGDRLPLPLIGRVEAQSEAVLRSEASGEISRITKDFGDTVRIGEIIAEIDNAIQRAEVLRAQGVLQAAQANLLKIRSGSGDSIILIKESVRSAFTTADDAVRNKVDQFIEDPDEAKPDIVAASSDYFIRLRAEAQRAELTSLFEEWTDSITSLDSIDSSEALLVYVLTAQANLEEIRTFLDDIALIVAGYEPSKALSQTTIDKWRNDVAIARSNINNSLSSLISSYNTLRSQVDSTTVGEDVLAAEAQVTQAEAGVLAAQAALEKTIIRSPISGEINRISITLGDFVSTLEEVAIVANNDALEITTFINEADQKSVAVGSNVKIEGGISGVVTRIAPALDRETGKIEVAIGVPGGPGGEITNGQSVSIEIERVGSGAASDVITIPISALKITSQDNFVFTVSPESTLVANKVQVGSIVGEKIIITDGIAPTMEIVLDARGLKEGQEVIVN